MRQVADQLAVGLLLLDRALLAGGGGQVVLDGLQLEQQARRRERLIAATEPTAARSQPGARIILGSADANAQLNGAITQNTRATWNLTAAARRPTSLRSSAQCWLLLTAE